MNIIDAKYANSLAKSVAYNSSIAAYVAYAGPLDATHTYGLQSTTLTLTDSSGASTFDLSNASYDTFGELQDAIAAIATGYWRLRLVGAKRADNTYSSNLKVNTVSAATVVPVTGGAITWNVANSSIITCTVGIEGDTDTTRAVPGWAKSGTKTVPAIEDPAISLEAYKALTVNDWRYLLEQAQINVTFAGTATIALMEATQEADGSTIYSDSLTTATDYDFIAGVSNLPSNGLTGDPRKRLIIRVTAAGGAPSAGQINLTGGYYFVDQ